MEDLGAIDSRQSGFQLGSEPLALVEKVRFDLGLECLEEIEKDILGGKSAEQRQGDENAQALTRLYPCGEKKEG